MDSYYRGCVMSMTGKALLVVSLLVFLCACPLATAQDGPKIPYSPSPDWISSDKDYATGCGFGDLDRDGWPDLVVANGNDMNRERVIVYYNKGDGTYPLAPDWTSADIDYHGHLSIGDIDGDGWLDVAVSVYLGSGGFSSKGYAKVYLNDGTGTLASNPSWRTQDDFYSFSLALGDADGDGDLDLAVATGEAYTSSPDYNRIYFNNGGTLSTTPGWMSTESDNSYDVAWGDLDNDGDLDLAFSNSRGPCRAYYNTGGGIQTTAGWTASTPSAPDGNTVTLGDVNGDGYLDFVFSDNSQISGGTGKFIAYFSDGMGGLATTPGWQSEYVGYVSGVVLCDVEGDGDKDVIGGSWWGAVRMYLNDNGTLSVSNDFISNTNSVVEAIPLCDADRAGHLKITGEMKAGDGQRKVFYFDSAPVVSVQAVVADGVPLTPSDFCYEPEGGWISLAAAPNTSLALDYTTTTSVDFAISNWDSGLGNYLFYREDLTVTATPPPNTNIKQGTSLPTMTTLANYTSSGRQIRVAGQVELPSGSIYNLGGKTGVLPGNLVYDIGRSFPVPMTAPLGSYDFIVILLEGGQEIDRDSFPFQVVP